MKLHSLLIITSALAAVFGIAFLLAPSLLFSLYGIAATSSLTYLGQLFGVDMLTFALLAWLARNASDSDARKAIVVALFVGFGGGSIIALMGLVKGVVNAFGWFTVVSYLFLAIGFGRIHFRKSV
jgi:hypothetical protein